MGSRLGQRASKCACVVVPPLFRADSGTNLVKQGENVKGRPSGSVAQLAECSHGKREALDSSPGRATIFSSPVTIVFLSSKLKLSVLEACAVPLGINDIESVFSYCYRTLLYVHLTLSNDIDKAEFQRSFGRRYIDCSIQIYK